MTSRDGNQAGESVTPFQRRLIGELEATRDEATALAARAQAAEASLAEERRLLSEMESINSALKTTNEMLTRRVDRQQAQLDRPLRNLARKVLGRRGPAS